MKAGFAGSLPTLAIASSRVPSALGLAGLSKPTWLSEICRKLKPASAALAVPSNAEVGTPPDIVQTIPVPAQIMHSRAWRRLMPLLSSLFMTQSFSFAKPADVVRGDDRAPLRFIPEFSDGLAIACGSGSGRHAGVRFCSR